MGFAAHERQRLLAVRGIGPRVLDRLEEAGIHSLQDLRRVGVAAAVEAVCERMGCRSWVNRRDALERLLDPPAVSPTRAMPRR